MKTFITAVAVVAGMTALATNAYASKDSYCRQVANNAVAANTHPLASAGIGCALGAGIGSLLTKGKAGGVGAGCAVGAGSGLVVTSGKGNRIYDEAYANCMSGGAGYVPPPAYIPPPSGGATAPWTHTAVTTGNPTSNVRTGDGTANPVAYALPYNTNVSVNWCKGNGWCRLADGNWISQSILHFY